MPVFRGVNPVVWGKLILTPHRENPPRTQCRACAGGGSINDVWCRECQGLGYHDAGQPPRSTKTSDVDAY